MIEPEFIDDENIPLLERDENNDSVYEDTQTETSFSHDDVIQQDIEKIDREINALERGFNVKIPPCLLYTSPSPRDATLSRMPSSA